MTANLYALKSLFEHFLGSQSNGGSAGNGGWNDDTSVKPQAQSGWGNNSNSTSNANSGWNDDWDESESAPPPSNNWNSNSNSSGFNDSRSTRSKY